MAICVTYAEPASDYASCMTTVYNHDLALYDMDTGRDLRRPLEECLPPQLETDHAYPFAKPGHRNYLPEVPVTLMEIKKDEVLFDMKALIQVTHSGFEMRDGKAYTTGTFVVRELLHS